MLIELKKVSKVHNKYPILKDINLGLDKEGIYGLIGNNGCGKTSLIRLLTAYFYPSSGSIKVLGYDIVKEPREALTQIGYWPEKNALYENMTVLEYLSFIGRAKGISKGELQASLEELLESFSLTPMRYRLTQTLSKGYAQRLGLASAFLGSPKLVILDEPLNGLDSTQILTFRHFLLKKASQMSLFLSSHHLSELEHMCDTLILMDEGNIKAVGSLKKLNETFSLKQQWQLEINSTKINATQLLRACPLFEVLSIREENNDYKLMIQLKEEVKENEVIYWLNEHSFALKSLSQVSRSLHKLLSL